MTSTFPATTSVDAMLAAARAMDERALRAVLRDESREIGVNAAIADTVLPFLNAVGQAWERGDCSVASEHFASQVMRSWLTGAALADTETTSTAMDPVVLACPPGERHDLGLLCFHVLLMRSGVPSRFLGSDTPLPGLADVCRVVGASGVIVAATRQRVFEAHGGALRVLARHYPLAIGGAGADADVAERVHARLLPADMRTSLAQVIRWHRGDGGGLPVPA
ncbi:cobalamin B12-binding domain-containing protein [Knoellia sp. CPCC 206450]|uniref:cobalamin B12-binding domain-containing protein n=1 Tax=Knoellia tibetensis TaxID=3404798 RepID=UPI003B42AAC9